ncbi:MAG: hypothetical protein U9Q82_12470 [Chloroflexota bacterium]|nr:hypothetical protein [Chloroflexota bacterium]
MKTAQPRVNTEWLSPWGKQREKSSCVVAQDVRYAALSRLDVLPLLKARKASAFIQRSLQLSAVTHTDELQCQPTRGATQGVKVKIGWVRGKRQSRSQKRADLFIKTTFTSPLFLRSL